MKIIPTLALSALFMVASTGIIAEEGLIRAIEKTNKTPKPLINVRTFDRPVGVNHIRELHGDINQSRVPHSKTLRREHRLARYKAKLRQQKQDRLLRLSGPRVTAPL